MIQSFTSKQRIEIIIRMLPYLEAHLLTKDQLVGSIKNHLPLASDFEIDQAFDQANVNSLFQ